MLFMQIGENKGKGAKWFCKQIIVEEAGCVDPGVHAENIKAR